MFLFIMSLFVDIHPNGYKGMTLSSILYFIGAIIYYIWLKSEVKKQNDLLKSIQEKKININLKVYIIIK